jgi:AraC-like DNA-binding protein
MELRPGAGTVRTQTSGDERRGWQLHVRPPAAALRGLVVGDYQGYREWGGAIQRRSLPGLFVPVIVSFGPRWWITDAGRTDRGAFRGTFVAGVHDVFAVNASTGQAHGMQVDLTPIGASLLLGVPMHELTCRVLDLESLLGADADRLADRLATAPGWPARFALLDRFLLERLRDVSADRAAPPDLVWAWERLVVGGGRARVADLAREIGCSRKHLGVRFRDRIGVSPQRANRLLRFGSAVALLDDVALSLSDVAQSAGYYDQAHFSRDVRTMSGLTPTALRAQRMPFGGVATGEGGGVG